MTQYIRINNPWFLELDTNGRPASGYLVYTLQAGTVSTLVTTYQDRNLTVANANPIVLNSRGEAHIFTNTAVKLVYTRPGGDLTSPIWTEDYASEQQNVIADNCQADCPLSDNQYQGSTSPAYAAVPIRFSLVITPTFTNLATLGTTNVSGVTGINDLTFSGRYIGTTDYSIFSVEILAAFISPPAAPTIVENVAAGLVTAGAHRVKLTAVTAAGETSAGTASNSVTAAGARKIDVSGIPALAGAVTGYKVYMTAAGGSVYYYVATVTATTYTINIADATLITNPVIPSANTTGDGVNADLVRTKKAGATVSDVGIDPSAAQTILEEVKFRFAEKVGHTEGDIWTVQVRKPVRFDFCGLTPTWIVYKSEGGQLVALDAADLINGYSYHFDAAVSMSAWILINPSLPVLSELPRKIYRREVTTDSTVTVADAGNEISYIGAGGHTLTLMACTAAAGYVFDLFNATDNNWTIQTDPTKPADRVITPESPSGVTSFVLGPGQRKGCRLVSNGVNHHMENDANYSNDFIKYTVYSTAGTFTWTKTAGYNWAKSIAIGAGAGGAGLAGAGAANGGGAGGYSEKVIDITAITSETVTVGAKGVGGVGATAATAGGTSSFGTHVTATGGAAAGPVGGTPGIGGVGAGGDINADGMPGGWPTATESGYGGSGPYGGGAIGVNADGDGNDAAGPGSGGSGAFTSGPAKNGGDGADGLVIVMEYR